MTDHTDPQPTGRAMTMREIREALGHNVTSPASATDRGAVPTDEDFLVAIEEALEKNLLPSPGFAVLERTRDAVCAALGPLVAQLRAAVLPAPDQQAAECPECNDTGACNGGPCPLRRWDMPDARPGTTDHTLTQRHAREAQQDPTQDGTAHHCGNCEGIDPDSCLFNPHRPSRTAVARPGQPDTEA